MKYLWCFVLGLTLTSLSLSFRHEPPPTPLIPHYGGEVIVDFMGDASPSPHEWKAEVARRFPDAVIVFCHGYDKNRVWTAHPLNDTPERPVAELALELRNSFPDRPIVLITCNPGHHALGIRGVYHAVDTVWMMPDKNQAIPLPFLPPEGVGNIFEFTDDLAQAR